MYKSLLICLSCAVTIACHRADNAASTATSATPVQPAATEVAYTPGPQPTANEIRDAIARNYAGAVTIDQTQPVLTGDFNGDHSEDIAIVVKPGKGKLPELNNEYANWILEDPRHRRSETPKTVGSNDSLLAVIHGHENRGWRSDSARQTYLLKNAVGVDLVTENAKHLNGGSLPFRGDVIREKLNGAAGIIYWNGGKYSWHPVS